MTRTNKRILSLLLVLAMLFGVFATTAAAAPADTAASIYDLRVNDLDAPVGLDETPAFSWKMASDAIGAAQSAYQIIVTDAAGAELWNTGWVEDNDSTDIEYAGKELAPATEYAVTVAIKDEKGAEVPAAETTFETGLFGHEGFADAMWISYSGANTLNNAPAFRKSINIREGLVSAKLYTSGLGVYENYINGERVGRLLDDETVAYDVLKPGFTEASDRIFYSAYDVTWMLEEGENVLGAVITSGWWNGDSTLATGRGKANAYIAKLILTYEDGTETVVTDTSWKAARAGAVLSTTSIYSGERYDATTNLSWMKPGFNDEAWGNVVENHDFVGRLCAWIGATTVVRDDLELSPKSIQIYEGATGASNGYYGKINVVATYEDGDDVTLNPGQTLLVNFGQNFAGWEGFTVTSEAGTQIHVEHGEWVNDNNGATSRGNDGPEGSIYNANYRGATANTYYTTAGGENESWCPNFSFYGFQYIEVTVDKPVTFHDIRGHVVTSVHGETSEMVTSDKDVNQLLSNARWGMYSNYLSLPTDCPQRNERMGWTADTQVFSMAGMFLGDNKSFLEKAVQDIRDAQITDANNSLYGAYPETAPKANAYNGAGAFGWADAGIIVPYNLYMMYGDIDVIVDGWDSMCLYMDEYLADTKYGGKQNYGDWLAYESNSTACKNILGVAYICWDALMMADMAEAIGNDDDAAKYMEVYETRKAQYIEEFINADGTVQQGTQAICLYTLFLDLVPNEESFNTIKRQLITNIESNGNKLGTGFLGTAIIMQTLTDLGRSDVAYRLLLQHDNPSWLYSVDQGATTFWERWNTYTIAGGFGEVSMNSFNHYAYGAVAAWMYRDMAGIGYDPENPGYQSIILAPQPDQTLPSVEASYDSIYGTIVSNMNYDGTTWNYYASIPANTTAVIQLPVEQIDTLTVNGKAPADVTLDADGLVYKGYENGIALFDAVAGSFTFSSTITIKNYVNITANLCSADVATENGEVRVNGELVASGVPATLVVQEGDVITATTGLRNDVDYEISNWTVNGEVIAEGSSMEYVATGSAKIEMNVVKKTGLVNLAEGKPVTAQQVNNTWKASNLTDGCIAGVLGTSGWSSRSQGSGVTKFSTEVTAVIDLGEATTFNRFHIYPRNDTFNNGQVMCFPTAYTVYVSDDNETWTPVFTEEDGELTNGFQPVVIVLDHSVSARYVKLGVSAINQGDDYGAGYVQLSEFGIYFDRNIVVDVNLSGEETVTVDDEELTYTVTAGNANELATVTLSFQVDGLADPVVDGANGWYVIAQEMEDGILTAVLCNNEGLTCVDPVAIATLTAGNPGLGTASVTLTDAVLSAYTGDTEAFVFAEMGNVSVTTEISYSIYDVNQDGTVDQLDITRAQRFFGSDDEICDVDDNGEVDITDLVLIMSNYSK